MSQKKISRKDFLKLGGAGLGAVALGTMAPRVGGHFARSAESGDRPNILFITVDQLHSLVDLPEKLPLPTFWRLEREGRSFTNYHVHLAPCGPSRSVIYTGQYSQKTGMYTNPPGEYAELPEGYPANQLSPDFPTIGKMLREAGYYTAYKGKWHLSLINQSARTKAGVAYPRTEDSLEPYGFSDYNFDGEQSGMTWVGFGHDGQLAADSVELLNNFAKGRTKGKPWFFAVNFINPHDIMFYEEPDPNSGEKRPPTGFGVRKEPPLTPLYEKAWNFPLPKSLYEDDLSTKPAAQRRSAGPAASEELTPSVIASWQEYQDYYFNCIRDVDRHIALVLDSLEKFGLADNTVVIVTSDHGEMGGAHRLKGKGAYIYKECLRVPLIVRHPRTKGGKATDALAGSVDLVPTLLSFAGLGAAERAGKYPYLHGVDLGPAIMKAGAQTDRDSRGILFDYMTPGFAPAGKTIAEIEGRNLIRGVFDGRYKFGRYFRPAEHHTPKDWETLVAHNDLELYDTEKDPDELVNLALKPEDYRDLILSLNAKVNALIAKEVGEDDGSVYPGPVAQYMLKSAG